MLDQDMLFMEIAILDHNLNGTNGFQIPGIQSLSQMNNGVVLGDINGDKINDFVVCTYATSTSKYNFAGACYFIFGTNSTFPGVFDITTLNGTNGFTIYGNGT